MWRFLRRRKRGNYIIKLHLCNEERKNVGNKVKIIQFRRKNEHCCFIGALVQNIPKQDRQCNRQHHFVSMGSGLPLMGAKDTDQGINLRWPKYTFFCRIMLC
jgi:hypothetical protein